MATRTPRRRRCRNCPEAGDDGNTRTWQSVARNMQTSAEFLSGCTATDVPGEVLPVLKRLHAGLGRLITTCEE